MAKYDEFGRPIYETAEEYNKAHKRGSTSRMSNSSEGNSYKFNSAKKAYGKQSSVKGYATRTSSKKPKLVIIGIAIFFIVMASIILFNRVGYSSGVYEEIEDAWMEMEDGWMEMEQGVVDEGEYLGDDTTPLPEGFETFLYNSQTFSLPATYEELSEMGLTLESEYDETDLFPSEYETSLNLTDEEGFIEAMFYVSNYTGEECLLKECQVNYFYIENLAAIDGTSEVPDFEFGDGLTFESSYEELETYLGIPYYHYEDDSDANNVYENFEWRYYGEGESHMVSVSFWNGKILNIGIEKHENTIY